MKWKIGDSLALYSILFITVMVISWLDTWEIYITTPFLCYFRILTLIRETATSFDEEYKRKQNAKSNHAMLDSSITLGKVKHYIKVNHTASLLYFI